MVTSLQDCDEDRHMKWGEDSQLLKDANGAEYLEYSVKHTKTRTGTEPRNIRTVKPKAPKERNSIFVYKMYAEERPTCGSMKDNDASL